MSFDGIQNAKIEARMRLIDALRGEMPRDFRWEFEKYLIETKNCGMAGCACGLAQHIGIVDDICAQAISTGLEVSRIVGRAIGIPDVEAVKIFNPASTDDGIISQYGVQYSDQVTPQMVADKLERLPLKVC